VAGLRNRGNRQQQQQQLSRGKQLAQYLPNKTLQHLQSCKAMAFQSEQYGGLQDVPLIPLQVLLGNPLYSSAKVSAGRSFDPCSPPNCASKLHEGMKGTPAVHHISADKHVCLQHMLPYVVYTTACIAGEATVN
jgi:hypothetical protein